MNPKTEDLLNSIRTSPELKDRPLHSAARQIPILVAKWDLKDNGTPVPVTEEAILEHDVPSDVLFSVLSAVYEYQRPPKVPSGRLPNTSSQEE